MSQQNRDFKNTFKVFNILSIDDEKYRVLLDNVCKEIAQRLNVYDLNGKARKANIIDAMARTSCISCIIKILSDQSLFGVVDTLYKECHKLAVNILVEELYHILNQMGYKVLISTEAELECGKADILITVTNHGLNLKGDTKELLVEVKTGNSLLLSQLFRYLLDKSHDTIVVWRVRKRQVLVFNVKKIRLLLTEFMRMIFLRATRLLSSQQIQQCQHTRSNYQPTQEELQIMFEDFSRALIESLPTVLQTILQQLGKIAPQESMSSNG